MCLFSCWEQDGGPGSQSYGCTCVMMDGGEGVVVNFATDQSDLRQYQWATFVRTPTLQSRAFVCIISYRRSSESMNLVPTPIGDDYHVSFHHGLN